MARQEVIIALGLLENERLSEEEYIPEKKYIEDPLKLGAYYYGILALWQAVYLLPILPNT
jgi:hypothetical protein